MNIPVIFQDNNTLVVNKPSGLVVHPFDFSEEETLLDFLLAHIPESFSISNEMKLQDGRALNLGGIVHKLDRDTSGVMVVTNNEKTFDELKKQFRGHAMKKQKIVTKYLTRKPETEAGKELRSIMLTLSHTNEKEFTLLLTHYNKKWSEYLQEKTFF